MLHMISNQYKFKIITVVGTRPEIIKLARVIPELDKYTDQILVHSGQNYAYELKDVFWKDLELRDPDYSFSSVEGTLAERMAKMIVQIDEVFEKERPEALFILGDTNSCLAAVLMAKRRKIPIFHMEAGLRCFDPRVPEENNRKVVDHLSDINLVYTDHARRNLLAEGIRPDTIFKTGSPMLEITQHYKKQIESSEVLSRLQLIPGQYFLVSTHREENLDSVEHFNALLETLNAIAIQYQYPVIVSTHPRTRKKLDSVVQKDTNSLIRFEQAFGFFDYLKLQVNAHCVISDSGTITEDSSILSFPAVTIREAHERPEGTEEGTLIMCGLKPAVVLQAIATVTAQHSSTHRQFRLVPDYKADNVSKKVVRIILSYKDYINRTVWYKL